MCATTVLILDFRKPKLRVKIKEEVPFTLDLSRPKLCFPDKVDLI